MKKNTSITKKLGLTGLVLTLMTGGMTGLSAQSEEREARREGQARERRADRVHDYPQAEGPNRDRERPPHDAAPARGYRDRGDRGMRPNLAPEANERSGNAPSRRADRPTNNGMRRHSDAAPAGPQGRRGGPDMQSRNTPHRNVRPDQAPPRRGERGPGTLREERPAGRRGQSSGVSQRGPQRSGPPWLQRRMQGSRENGPFQFRQNRPGSGSRPAFGQGGPRGPRSNSPGAFGKMQSRRFGPMQRRAIMQAMQRSQGFRAMQADRPERGRPDQNRRSLERGPSKRGKDSEKIRPNKKRDDHKRKNLKSKNGGRSEKHALKGRDHGRDRGKSGKANFRKGNEKKKDSNRKGNQKRHKNQRNNHAARR